MNKLKIVKKVLICIIAVMMIMISMLSALRIQAEVIPDSTEDYVNDYADVISDATFNYIANKNSELERGAEILVVTTEYITSDDLEEFNYELFNQWGIGSVGFDNGVLITLVTKEGKYWVTVGKGLERELSASVLSDILDRCMEDDFDKGNYDRAVRNTFDEIYKIVSNKYNIKVNSGTTSSNKPSSNKTPSYSKSSSSINPIIVILFIVIAIFVVRSMIRNAGSSKVVVVHDRPRPHPNYPPRDRYHEPPRPEVRPQSKPSYYEMESDRYETRRPEPDRPKRESSSNSSWGSSSSSSSSFRQSSSSRSSSNVSSSRASSTPTRSSSSTSRGSSSPSRSSAPSRSSGGGSSRGGGAGRK